MTEDKQAILDYLTKALQLTKDQQDLADMTYIEANDQIQIAWDYPNQGRDYRTVSAKGYEGDAFIMEVIKEVRRLN